MTTRTHIRQSWSLAVPVMLSQLGHVAMGVSDNIMVGHVNAVSLAAAGLALIIINVLMLFGIGVSLAITPLVAEAQGRNDGNRIASILRHGLIVNLLNSLLLVGIVLIGKRLLFYLGQPQEVVVLAIPYLSILAYSLVPMLIFQSFKQFTDGLSKTKVAMIVIISANLVNIVLNYAFIFGAGPILPMGLVGAGWATLCSRIIMMIGIAVYIYYSPSLRAYRDGFIPAGFFQDLFKAILRLGIPSGGQFIFEVAAFDFSLVMMGWIGTETLAAHQIAINLATISYMTTSGLAMAATIRVGYFLGKKDARNLKVATYTLLTMALCLMTAWSVLFIAGRHLLPVLYVDNTDVIEIASVLLVVAGLFQLADGAQVVCTSALRGLQDVKVPMVFIAMAYWVIGLPLGYWLTFYLKIGAVGVWIGLLTGLTVTALAMFFRFRKLAGQLAFGPQA